MTYQLPETGYLRLSQIIGDDNNVPLFPVSKSTWWAGVKAGRYPKPIKLSPRVTAWSVESIRKLLEHADGSDISKVKRTGG